VIKAEDQEYDFMEVIETHNQDLLEHVRMKRRIFEGEGEWKSAEASGKR